MVFRDIFGEDEAVIYKYYNEDEPKRAEKARLWARSTGSHLVSQTKIIQT